MYTKDWKQTLNLTLGNEYEQRVQSLKRVRVMNIKLDLPTGKYREFTNEELLELNELLENSSKTFD